MAVGGIGSTSVGTTSVEIAAACPGRHYLRITNEHATATLAVNFGGTAALNSTGGNFTLTGFNSGANRIEFTHPPDTAVHAIASGAGTPVTIEEW